MNVSRRAANVVLNAAWIVIWLAPAMLLLGAFPLYISPAALNALPPAIAEPVGIFLRLSPEAQRSTAFTWFLRWTVLVGLVRLFWLPPAASRLERVRVRCFVAWLGGAIALAAWGPAGISSILPVVADDPSLVSAPAPLLAGWSTVVIVFYIYRASSAESQAARYRLVWASLAFMIFATFVINYRAYHSVRARVDGLLAMRALAESSVDQLESAANRLAGGTFRLSQCFDNVDEGDVLVCVSRNPYGQAPAGVSTILGIKQEEARRDAIRSELVQQVRLKLPGLAAAAAAVDARAQGAKRQIDAAAKQQPDRQPGSPGTENGQGEQSLPVGVSGTSLVQASQVISEAAALAERLPDAVANLGREVDNLGADRRRSLDALKTVLARDLFDPATQAYDHAQVANRAVHAVEVPVIATFLSIAALYSCFLLFPWVLVLLFLYRKGELRAVQILDDLTQLDGTQGLLRRLLAAATMGREGAAEAEDLEQSIERLEVKCGQFGLVLSSEKSAAIRNVLDRLAARAFGSGEYLSALALLSVATAVGWYCVLYPNTTVGLAVLIVEGGGNKEFAGKLLASVTPLTLGFVGAYFFVMQLLVRRYVASDLYPSPVLQAGERLLRGFILGYVVLILAGFAGWEPGPVAAAVAFVAGVFPSEGLSLIVRLVNRATNNAFNQTGETAPLTKLDGINIWTETRLFEENVDNVQALATARIERLVLRTHFSTARLIDWIDQAIFYSHAGDGGEWFPAFRGAGIRTASDLLHSVGLEPGMRPETLDFAAPKTSEAVRHTVAAVNAAQEGQATRSILAAAQARVPAGTNQRALPTAAATMSAAPRTSESSASVGAAVAEAHQATTQAAGVVASLVAAVGQLEGAEEKRQAVRTAAALLKEALDQAAERAGSAHATAQRMILGMQGGDDVALVKSALDSCATMLAEAAKDVTALEAAAQALAVPDTSDSLREFQAHAKAARAALGYAQESAGQARERSGRLAEVSSNVALADDAAHQASTLPQLPQMTVDILYDICQSIWPDPNVDYVLNYNTPARARSKKSGPPTKTRAGREDALVVVRDRTTATGIKLKARSAPTHLVDRAPGRNGTTATASAR